MIELSVAITGSPELVYVSAVRWETDANGRRTVADVATRLASTDEHCVVLPGVERAQLAVLATIANGRRAN